ncbi:unnamed protein product [Coregonus sp. 'balchen']|nr:unnamed protein product [Coregonus sp. 'balchen']
MTYLRRRTEGDKGKVLLYTHIARFWNSGELSSSVTRYVLLLSTQQAPSASLPLHLATLKHPVSTFTAPSLNLHSTQSQPSQHPVSTFTAPSLNLHSTQSQPSQPTVFTFNTNGKDITFLVYDRPYPDPASSSINQPYTDPASTNLNQPYPDPSSTSLNQPYPDPSSTTLNQPYPDPSSTSLNQPYPDPALTSLNQPHPEPALLSPSPFTIHLQTQSYLALSRPSLTQPYPDPVLPNLIQTQPNPALSRPSLTQPYPDPALSCHALLSPSPTPVQSLPQSQGSGVVDGEFTLHGLGLLWWMDGGFTAWSGSGVVDGEFTLHGLGLVWWMEGLLHGLGLVWWMDGEFTLHGLGLVWWMDGGFTAWSGSGVVDGEFTLHGLGLVWWMEGLLHGLGLVWWMDGEFTLHGLGLVWWMEGLLHGLGLARRVFNSRSLALQAQKKILSKMATMVVANLLTDDVSSEILDELYKASREFTKSKKEAHKIVKDVIKIALKIGILYRNHQFSPDELDTVERFKKKMNQAAMTAVSFYEVDYTFDHRILSELLLECRDLLHALVEQHLTPRSHIRIDHVFNHFAHGDCHDVDELYVEFYDIDLVSQLCSVRTTIFDKSPISEETCDL